MRLVLSRLFVVGLLFLPSGAFAATLYMSPNETELHPGDTIAVSVRIDTNEGECVNVVDGVINYTENISLVDVSRGESILPVWVEDPQIDKENNRVTFAGGIPNGYCGRIDGDPGLTNVLVELIFQAPGFVIGIGERDPYAQVSFDDQTQVLLNDGLGTQAPLRTLGSSIFVHEKPGGELIDEWNNRVELDTIPPSEFSISLERDVSAFGGRYFIVFNTTDKQSGLEHYEVIEEPLDALNLFSFGGIDAPWTIAKSPYLLKDQTLNSTIRVRAIDKAGNEYIATLVPDESLRGASERTYLVYVLAGMGVVTLIGVLVVVVVMSRNARRKKQTEGEFEENIAYDE